MYPSSDYVWASNKLIFNVKRAVYGERRVGRASQWTRRGILSSVYMQPKKADRLPFWKDTGPAELLLALYTGFGLTVIQSLRISIVSNGDYFSIEEIAGN